MLEKGKKVGEYVLLEKLGAGGFGEVWKAEKRTELSTSHFALKFFRPKDDDTIDLEIVKKEIQTWQNLSGLPNVISVIEANKFEDYVFIVSEFAEGGSLEKWLKANDGKAKSPAEAVAITRQILQGLEAMHDEGFVHRDLKPANVLLKRNVFYLADFGISRQMKTHSKATGMIGTYEFMPPEAFEKNPSISFHADIWAVGAILQVLLTGQLPYPQDELPSLYAAIKYGEPEPLPESVPPALCEIVVKALQKKREDRFQSAGEMREVLRNALTQSANLPVVTIPVETNAEQSKTEPFLQSGKESNEAKTEHLLIDEIAQIEKKASEKKTKNLVIIPTQDWQAIEAEKERQRKLAETERQKEAEKARLLQEIEVKRQQAENEHLEREKQEKETGEKVAQRNASWTIALVAIFAFVVIIALTYLGIFLAPSFNGLFNTTSNQPTNISANKSANPSNTNSPMSQEIDSPPLPRQISQPPNTIYFKNSKQNLDSAMMKNFLGFSLYYPKDWSKAETSTKFLDVSKKASNGFPIEQLLITHYRSLGTMTLDIPTFPKLVEKSNADLKKNLGDNYKVISQGVATIQDGRWKVYEVKFQSSGKNEKGETVMIWGRCLWISVQRAGVQNGFVVTMLATSLSDAVKSVDDVGTQGDLVNILETFEPSQIY